MITEQGTKLAALEELNKQSIIREDALFNSKEFQLGATILRYGQSILKLNFLQLFRDLKKRSNAKKLRRIPLCPTVLPIVEYNCCHKSSKIAVYTCVVKGYDSIMKPLINLPNVDYFLFVDDPNLYGDLANYYIIREIPENLLSLGGVLANRYMKLHPKEFFDGYDFTIYMDGNIQAVSDIREFVNRCSDVSGIALHTHRERNCVFEEAKACILSGRGDTERIRAQMQRYREAGMPAHYGLNEAGIIAANNRSELAEMLLHQWWEEVISSRSMRDQLAWPYVLWKNGLKLGDVGNLGCNIMKNYKVRITKHY